MAAGEVSCFSSLQNFCILLEIYERTVGKPRYILCTLDVMQTSKHLLAFGDWQQSNNRLSADYLQYMCAIDDCVPRATNYLV